MSMRIIIDGDGSPVKDTTIEIAAKFQLPVVIVTSIDHYSKKEYPDWVEFVYVDPGFDSADYKIVSLIKKTDILITQDYGLASLTLKKAASVLHQSGLEYTVLNIGPLLDQRYFSSKMRQAKQKTKGPKAYTQDDRAHFSRVLCQVIERQLK